MAYFIPANTPLDSTEQQEVSTTTAPRTPAVHQSASKARPIRVVSMGDGPHGKQVVCEFPDGWQRTIDLPTEVDAWHPLFDNLPKDQKHALHSFAKPAAYVDANGVRKRRDGVSFITSEVGRNGGCKKYRWFDVPDEEHGAGQITGYRAAGELLEALARGYGPNISVGHILKEVFTASDESYSNPSRRGAAAAFAWVLDDALKFFAKNAKHGPWLDGKVAQTERTNAYFAQQAENQKAEFTQRMKAAKAAKKAARQGGAA